MYLSLLLAFASVASAAAPTVTLGRTTLVGRDVTLLQQDFFGGIPFAKPPLGELRLKPPVKAELDVETFDASSFSPFCLQPNVSLSQMSEDCLTINVFRPSSVSAGANLPVMFWTYGGGFQAGSANMYNASAIVAQSAARGTPIVFVSFNYRLGPLGFPQGGEADRKGSLNLALRDQILALEWVQENIHAFGGDKDKVGCRMQQNRPPLTLSKVTIFGESAGAIMIAVQFLNPNFSKLVRGAIFESGSAATPLEHTAEVREVDWTNFVAGVPECASVANSSNTFDCLRTANTSSIFMGLEAAIAEADEQFAFDPTLDGPGGFLPERPSKLWEKGQFARLPFITGTNLDEGTVFTPRDPEMDYGEQALRQMIRANLSPPDVSVATLDDAIDRIVELYPDIPALGSPFNTGNETFGLPQGFKRFAAINGDVTFQSQRRLWQQTVSETGVKTYGYLFTQPQPGNGAAGVSHGSEVFYVFGLVTNETDVSLSRVMIDYWVSFVTCLDPNDGKGLPRPTWDHYAPNKQVLLELNSANTRLIPDNYREEQIDFINRHPLTFLHRRSV
ncbi:hypothetical protein V5O48_003164 [Marasmius crinis-equi]|uniref:Carboxylesterase type B domain-containing protein n=1 Tax=Marasmius crinis-equi TaxID=585013 RepID=A0ABR3FTP5_9AGAR